MDRLGHQQQSRRDAVARPLARSTAHTVGGLGDAGAREVATATD
jgi:hypothetical protein